MKNLWAPALGAWLAGAAACAPSSSAPVPVMAMLQSKAGGYQLSQVSLKTVSDVVTLQGSTADFVGGARIVIDDTDPALANAPSLTDAQLAAIFVKNSGAPPKGNYVQNNGVFWPSDFHTLNMVSLYFNFEQALTYFQDEVGVPGAELTGSTVYYFPSFEEAQVSPSDQSDDAFWFSPVQGFVILPFSKLQATPLAMNAGVIAHEFSHRVWNRRVYGGASEPAPLNQWANSIATKGLNILRSVDEGLADFHAYGASCATAYGCNPRYLETSFDEATATRRDFSQNDRCMTQNLRDAISALPYNDSNGTGFGDQGFEYTLGTVFASAIYHAEEKLNQRQAMEKAILASYSDTSPEPGEGLAQFIATHLSTPDTFDLPRVANTLIAHIPDVVLRGELCGQFLNRLQLGPTDLQNCPDGAPIVTDCPNIPATP